MKKNILYFFLFLLLIAISQNNSFGSTAESILNLQLNDLPNLFVSDAFTPMTHFNKNDIQFSLTPVYLHLPLGYDKKRENVLDDFYCKAAGFNVGYAISDRWVTGIFYDYCDVTGKIGYNNNGNISILDGNQTIQSYMFIVGYDFLESESNSLPLIFGIGKKYIKVDMDISGTTYPPDYTVKSNCNSVLYFIGLVYSWKLTISDIDFKFTPYLYYIDSGRPEFTFISESSPSDNYSATGLSGETIIDGFHFGCIYDGLGITFSVNSEYTDYYYNSFDNVILNGLYMLYVGVKELAYTVTFSYTF